MLDAGLRQQAEFDVEGLEQLDGRVFSKEQRAQLVAAQHRAHRGTYLASGIEHPQVIASIDWLSAGKSSMIRTHASRYR